MNAFIIIGSAIAGAAFLLFAAYIAGERRAPGAGQDKAEARALTFIRPAAGSGLCHAPFTPEEIDSLEAWQNSPHCHPLTCCGHQKLVVLIEGLRCPACGHCQQWAPRVCAEFAGIEFETITLAGEEAPALRFPSRPVLPRADAVFDAPRADSAPAMAAVAHDDPQWWGVEPEHAGAPERNA